MEQTLDCRGLGLAIWNIREIEDGKRRLNWDQCISTRGVDEMGARQQLLL